ncbi:MAG: hypothetical protein ABI599_02510 [Flavobacteriales bacterium]
MRAAAFVSAIVFTAALPSNGASAQVLFVNDNDNITYNTDTILNDLVATGLAFDTYDIPDMGAPPDGSVLGNYATVIWYCSGDGADLGLWDPTAQAALVDLVLAGKTLWLIGTDALYAQYGSAPVTFTSGDFALDALGIASYDVQSYGDDGGLGCPQMDVAPGVAGQFAATLLWSFSTFWWADGCTPTLDAEAVYIMGPSSYALFGAQSMIHFHPSGTNVMSTFFDPTLIDTYANRVLFLDQTIAYLGIGTGIAPIADQRPVLVVMPAVNGGLAVTSREPLRDVDVRSASGQCLHYEGGMDRRHVELDLYDLASGVFIISATTTRGSRMSAKWIKE